jgi:hypothetical protein
VRNRHILPTALSSQYESAEITTDVQTLLAGLAAKGLVTYDT